MTIKLLGDVIGDDYADFYDYFGMDYISPKSVANQLDELDGEPADIIISSGGGEVFAGSEIYSILKNYSNDVNIQITGMAASAASVIAMGATNLSIAPTAMLMIHNASSVVQGDTNDMAHQAEVLANINESIANSYVLKTGMARDEVLDMMNNETWFTADKAKELGFADEVAFVEKDESLVTNSTSSMPTAKGIERFKALNKQGIDFSAKHPNIKPLTNVKPIGNNKKQNTEPIKPTIEDKGSSVFLVQQKLKILRGEN